MKNTNGTKHKRSRLTLIVTSLLLFSLILLFFLAGKSYLKRQSDQKLLRTEEYNSAFLSMFPIDTFSEEDFRHFRGDEVLKLTTVIPNCRTLKQYLSAIQLSGNNLRVLYLGVDPQKVNAALILQIRDAFPGVQIEVIPTYRPLQAWVRDAKADDTLRAYRELAEPLINQANIRIYSFFAQEWLIADPANYVSKLLLEKEAAHLVYVYTDNIHHCDFNSENLSPIFQEMETLLRVAKSGEYRFPDLSEWSIAFFGDSVIGNYTDRYSIPGLVSGFSGATCYNCGWGGTTASGDMPSSGIQVVSTYLNGMLPEIPENIAAHDGIAALMAAEEKNLPEKQLFVLHYGLNDYFQGIPLNSSDPLDPNTYCGAMRGIIEALRLHRPNAKLLIILPNHVEYCDGGKAITGPDGAPLESYVEALEAIAREYDIPTQDDYREIIPEEKVTQLIEGEIHPNEYGRYLIAKALTKVIAASFN